MLSCLKLSEKEEKRIVLSSLKLSRKKEKVREGERKKKCKKIN